ncbi:hypothetical protein V8F20_009160 [Naviculisporaceae sp. PSN 640]
MAEAVRQRPHAPRKDSATLKEEILGGPAHHLAFFPKLPKTRDPKTQQAPLKSFEDQRHPGKPDAKIHMSTRQPSVDSRFGEMLSTPDLPSVDPNSLTGQGNPSDDEHVTGFPLLCLIIGLMLAVFLISIDRTIISTAIPYITSEFHSTTDIGWYGSSYLVTACAFQPVFGRIFMLFDVKKAYLVAMFLFELGSLVCGVAPSSMALIVGRAIAGFGCAGVLTGSFVVVSTAVPLRMRPLFIAVVGVMFGVGATCGPLLGGVFTDLVTWRWCFYINLPIGGATVVAMILFFHPKKSKHAKRGFWDRFLDLDIIGNVLLLGASIMLFIALEYATIGVPWNSAKIIGLLVGFGVTAIVFAGWQTWKGDDALMPPRIVSQRTVAASCGLAFMTYGALINLTFFLPIWFQAIKGESAITSGVHMIPYFITNAFFSLLGGVFVSVVGYVTPPAVIGSAIGTAGLGLLTLLNLETTTAQWVGYEILSSAGFGLSIQQGFTAVQTVLGAEDMAIGTAAVVASQSLGGAIMLSVGNSVFQSQLQKSAGAVPGVDVKEVMDLGAAAFRNIVPAEQLPAMLEISNKALQAVFTVSIPLGGLAVLISCFLEWKSVKVKKGVDREKDRERGAEEDKVRVSIGGWQ